MKNESIWLKINKDLNKNVNFYIVKRSIQFCYYHPHLQIGMVDIKQVYLLEPELLQLNVEVYRGKIVYRAKGSSKRISYDQLKKGLVRKRFFRDEEVPDWLILNPTKRKKN